MLARFIQPKATSIAKRLLNGTNLRMIESYRYASHGSSSAVQHGDSHGAVDHHGHGHHDPHQTLYERLWQHKATLDWLPKPEGNWQEINGQKQAYHNRVLIIGIVSFLAALTYLRVVIVTQSGALTQPPYHLIGNEDFPGSKYDDATGVPQK